MVASEAASHACVSLCLGLLLEKSEGTDTKLSVGSALRVHNWHQNECFLGVLVVLPEVWIVVDLLCSTQGDMVERKCLGAASEAVSGELIAEENSGKSSISVCSPVIVFLVANVFNKRGELHAYLVKGRATAKPFLVPRTSREVSVPAWCFLSTEPETINLLNQLTLFRWDRSWGRWDRSNRSCDLNLEQLVEISDLFHALLDLLGIWVWLWG